MRPRDSQRYAVYRWEWTVREQWPEHNEVLSPTECQDLIQKVWNDRRPGEEPPLLRFRGRTTAHGSRWSITLPKREWGRQKLLVLHEIAHSLDIHPGKWDEPFHGPRFASLLLDLWVTYARIPREACQLIARTQEGQKVKFRPMEWSVAACRRQPTKEWLEWKQLEQQLYRMLVECRANEPDKYEEE